MEAYLAVQSQWRMVCPGDGTIRHSSLDYAAARVGWDLAGIVMTPERFHEVRVIEAGVRQAAGEAPQ